MRENYGDMINALFPCSSTVRDATSATSRCNKIATRIVRACKNIFFIQFQEVRLLRTRFSRRGAIARRLPRVTVK